jgi:hypothetical protein
MDLVALLVPIAAIFVGGLIILLPLAGLVARFALKPLVQAYVEARDGPRAGEQVQLLESRMSLLEEQVQRLERSYDRLAEGAEFQRRLDSPGAP